MADYISTLTGVQMDAALLDMAEHNSEAWAVGERNGIGVASDDVTYHNNARYYASQAQSIAPASVTEAVRWDVAQTALTDAQREQGRENIKATSHNYNLLDNSHFRVNSRGLSSYSTNGYTVDRWLTNYQYTVTVTNDGVTLANTGGYRFVQVMNNPASFAGKTVTLSAIVSGSTIYRYAYWDSASGYSNGVADNISTSGTGKTLISVTFTPTNGIYAAGLVTRVEANINVHAVKLELGSFSTLANDTPPDYGEELTRCIYSTADPSDTYANNGFGRSNENLLDNPWFTVSQKGNGPFTSGTTVDRWKFANQPSSVTVTSNGITLARGGVNGTPMQFVQQIEADLWSSLIGKPATASVMLKDGTITSVTAIIENDMSSGTVSIGSTGFGIDIRGVANSGYRWVRLTSPYNAASASIDVRAMKLELGSVSTLANDAPPDYGTELAKCQAYFVRYAFQSYRNPFNGVAVSATQVYFDVVTPVSMKAKVPTISTTGTLYALRNGSTGACALSVPSSVPSANHITIIGETTSLTAMTNVPLYTANNNFILDISCDL